MALTLQSSPSQWTFTSTLHSFIAYRHSKHLLFDVFWQRWRSRRAASKLAILALRVPKNQDLLVRRVDSYGRRLGIRLDTHSKIERFGVLESMVWRIDCSILCRKKPLKYHEKPCQDHVFKTIFHESFGHREG